MYLNIIIKQITQKMFVDPNQAKPSYYIWKRKKTSIIQIKHQLQIN